MLPIVYFVLKVLYMSKFLDYDVVITLKIVFILANSAAPTLCGISSGSSLFAKVPVYGYSVRKKC